MIQRRVLRRGRKLAGIGNLERYETGLYFVCEAEVRPRKCSGQHVNGAICLARWLASNGPSTNCILHSGCIVKCGEPGDFAWNHARHAHSQSRLDQWSIYTLPLYVISCRHWRITEYVTSLLLKTPSPHREKYIKTKGIKYNTEHHSESILRQVLRETSSPLVLSYINCFAPRGHELMSTILWGQLSSKRESSQYS